MGANCLVRGTNSQFYYICFYPFVKKQQNGKNGETCNPHYPLKEEIPEQQPKYFLWAAYYDRDYLLVLLDHLELQIQQV